MNSKQVGNIAEAHIIAKFVERGYQVSIPFGNNARYDLIVDDGERLLRVQCKTGHYRNGCIEFNTCSTNGFTKQATAYHGDVELFAVYYPPFDKVYVVPIDEVGTSKTMLRIEEPKQLHNVRKFARDYEL